MLLVGSLAARHHFPDFREPRGDVDLIATPEEADELAAAPGSAEEEPVRGKRSFVISGRHVEAELALPGTSAMELLPHSSGTTSVPGIGEVEVADPGVLFLLKRSHVAFKTNWPKTFKDYKILQGKGCYVPGYLAEVLELRIAETKERLKFKDRDFDVTNEDFFGKSAHAVRRFMPHDEIHEALKFGPIPMFKLIKEDQGVAAISLPMFEALSFQEKIWNMQEECMVLACERFVLPAVVDGEPYSERRAALEVLRGMCYNYLPFDFRLFAVDHFQDVHDGLPWGFSDRVISRMRELSP